MSKFNIAPFIVNGLADGFNPCIFSAIVFLVVFTFFAGYRPWQILLIGIFFIAAIFLTSLLMGLGFFTSIFHLEQFFITAKIFYISVSLAAVVLGGINFYDWVIFRKTNDANKTIFKFTFFTKKEVSGAMDGKLKGFLVGILKAIFLMAAALIAGFLFTIFQSACTGLIYAPAIFYFATVDTLKLKAAGYLVLYNVMFILPLAVIFFLAHRGVKSEKFTAFCKKDLAKVKIICSAVFFSIGFGLLYTLVQ